MAAAAAAAPHPQHIWLISGYAGAGKDTAATIMLEALGYRIAATASFAGAVKDEVARLYGIPRALMDTQEGKASRLKADGPTVREIIIAHAEGEKERTCDPYIWARRITPPAIAQHWILSDWRFPAEYISLRERFSDAAIHTVRVVRGDGCADVDSYTERALDSFQFDHILDNSGSLLFLTRQIHEIIW
jgi:hypothetical protein